MCAIIQHEETRRRVMQKMADKKESKAGVIMLFFWLKNSRMRLYAVFRPKIKEKQLLVLTVKNRVTVVRGVGAEVEEEEV